MPWSADSGEDCLAETKLDALLPSGSPHLWIDWGIPAGRFDPVLCKLPRRLVGGWVVPNAQGRAIEIRAHLAG